MKCRSHKKREAENTWFIRHRGVGPLGTLLCKESACCQACLQRRLTLQLKYKAFTLCEQCLLFNDSKKSIPSLITPFLSLSSCANTARVSRPKKRTFQDLCLVVHDTVESVTWHCLFLATRSNSGLAVLITRLEERNLSSVYSLNGLPHEHLLFIPK